MATQFSQSIEGLEVAGLVPDVEVPDGGVFDLTAVPVRKRVGDSEVRMLAYNGSIPGPVLRVRQGTGITVRFRNLLDLDTTVHWHGLRHDYLYDGVPRSGHHQGMQDPVRPGEGFTYRLRFPDPGIYWYHPHMREDYTQEMGLIGNIVVEPSDPDYWPPANRDLVLTVDDLLLEGGAVAPFSTEGSSHTAMGRYGNVMLVNGEVQPRLAARRGEIVRLYLTNTANTRVFRLAIPGARMKLVGSDLGRTEHEEFRDRIIIAPSERWVVDVLFPEAGELVLEHASQDRTYRLATFSVSDEAATPDLSATFAQPRHNPEFAAERARFDRELAREPDKVIVLEAEMPGMARDGMSGMAHDGMPDAAHHDAAHHGMDASHHGMSGTAHGETAGGHEMQTGAPAGHARPSLIEWEDTMPEHNAMSTPETMHWYITEAGSRRRNERIHWVFDQGDRAKIRIVNQADSDHPMQHPIHFHGQRFYELRWEGHRSVNLLWKDTVLVPAGVTVDILLDCSNPGSWMVHCHIAEHLEAGMMFTFEVRASGEADRVDLRRAG